MSHDDHDPMCQRDEPDHWCECVLIARVRAEYANLEAERDRALSEVAGLQGVLEEVVGQACYVEDNYEGGSHLDSMALSAYASGMRALAERGRITIEHEYGRRVIGRWVTP